MMADIEFKIEGLGPLLGKLEAVTYDVKRKGGRSALRKAAQLIAKAAQQNASIFDDPETKQSIAANIAIRWDGKRFKRNGDLGFRVGVLGGAQEYANTKDNVRAGRVGESHANGGSSKNPGGDTWYWRLLEFGTSKMQAKPFMRRALADNVDAATSAFVAAYSKAIDSAIKRAAKKAAQGV